MNWYTIFWFLFSWKRYILYGIDVVLNQFFNLYYLMKVIKRLINWLIDWVRAIKDSLVYELVFLFSAMKFDQHSFITCNYKRKIIHLRKIENTYQTFPSAIYLWFTCILNLYFHFILRLRIDKNALQFINC